MLEKVSPGQPFKPSAAMFNTFIDAATRFQRQQQTGGRPQRSSLRGATTILVCNNTGAGLDRYGVGTIDVPIIGPDDNEDNFLAEPAMSIVEPTAGDGGNVAIVLEPIAQQRFGLAAIAGASLVQISVSDAGHEYAEAKAGDVTQLQSAATGDIRILWAESGTGTVWTLVRLGGGSQPILGDASNPAIMAPASGSIETETAQTDTWDRASPPSGKAGVKLRTMRIAYNDAGDEKLYAFYRDLVFDSRGMLATISAETRVTIDVPDAC
jgi:hypothetical protein